MNKKLKEELDYGFKEINSLDKRIDRLGKGLEDIEEMLGVRENSFAGFLGCPPQEKSPYIIELQNKINTLYKYFQLEFIPKEENIIKKINKSNK